MNAKKLSEIENVEKTLNQLKEEWVLNLVFAPFRIVWWAVSILF